MYAAGPLSEADFKATFLQSQSTAFGKGFTPGKVLTRCAFALGTVIAPHSELYIANRTGKLYLSLPVDYLLPELLQQQAQGSLMEGSLFSMSSSIEPGRGIDNDLDTSSLESDSQFVSN